MALDKNTRDVAWDEAARDETSMGDRMGVKQIGMMWRILLGPTNIHVTPF